MKHIDKLAVALGDRELAKCLVSCIKKGCSKELSKERLSIALSNPALAEKLMKDISAKNIQVDMTELAMALADAELAKELCLIKCEQKEVKKKEVVYSQEEVEIVVEEFVQLIEQKSEEAIPELPVEEQPKQEQSFKKKNKK